MLSFTKTNADDQLDWTCLFYFFYYLNHKKKPYPWHFVSDAELSFFATPTVQYSLPPPRNVSLNVSWQTRNVNLAAISYYQIIACHSATASLSNQAAGIRLCSPNRHTDNSHTRSTCPFRRPTDWSPLIGDEDFRYFNILLITACEPISHLLIYWLLIRMTHKTRTNWFYRWPFECLI